MMVAAACEAAAATTTRDATAKVRFARELQQAYCDYDIAARKGMQA